VRISLDLYRILGLPPQATQEQIQLAYRDRSFSLPRREYSDAAIAARKRIIDKAYSILTAPANPQEAAVQESDLDLLPEANPESAVDLEISALPQAIQTIEVSERDTNGVLLLLFELGEYQRVLEINQSYIESNKISSQLKQSEIDIDTILTVALSHLEIGRDLWKEGQYDMASRSLETSQAMLLREGLFISIRSEIQADLLKLRPYRILELLAVPEEQTSEHKLGLSLLQEMLEARRGIDGTGNDYSGLDIDDFLRFMQQLRGYMTAAEQQQLFEEEARRPSNVASYLAVYALIARGFSQRQPALIRRAKGLLVKLSGKQDVHLEQAVCALLLGQAEEAGNTLEQSGEQDKLDFIRNCSEGAPDLLPGLCSYCQSWLQEEVYPYFRDLRDRFADLREYFADDSVEAYLEELSSASGTVGSEWTQAASNSAKTPTPVASVAESASFTRRSVASTEIEDRISALVSEPNTYYNSSSRVPLLERPVEFDSEERNGALPARTRQRIKDKERKDASPNKSKVKPKLQVSRLLILLFASVSLVASVGAALAWGWRTLNSPVKEEALTLIERPVAVLLDTRKAVPTSIPAQPGPLSKETAIKLVESWQVAKSKALGSNHQIPLLESILADPALSDWRSRAKDLKASNAYLQYIPKSLVIKKFTPNGANKASAIAQIEETRNYFSNGSLDASSSRPDTSYEVEYVLVKVSGKWMIADMLVAEK
jgi:ARC6-like, IMS domain